MQDEPTLFLGTLYQKKSQQTERPYLIGTLGALKLIIRQSDKRSDNGELMWYASVQRKAKTRERAG